MWCGSWLLVVGWWGSDVFGLSVGSVSEPSFFDHMLSSRKSVYIRHISHALHLNVLSGQSGMKDAKHITTELNVVLSGISATRNDTISSDCFSI